MGTRHVLVLSYGTFVVGSDGFILSGLLPAVASDLEVSAPIAGQLTTLFALTYALSSPVAAAAGARFTRRRMLIVGLAVFIVGLILQAAGTAFAIVAAGRIVAGTGAAMFQPSAFALSSEMSPPGRQGRALAIVGAGMSLSMVLGVPFGVAVGQLWGWRSAVWTIAALAGLAMLACAVLPTMRAPHVGLRDRLAILTSGDVLRILLTSSLVLVSGYAWISYLAVTVGDAAWAVGWGMLAFGIGEVVGLRVTGVWLDRAPPLRVLLAGAAATTFVFVAMPLAGGWPLGIIIATFALGVAAGPLGPPQQLRLLRADAKRGVVALGLNGSAVYVGASVGVMVGGAAVAAGAVPGLLMMCVGASLLAWGVAWLLAPERSSRPTR